jgi:hypothetical protein
MKTTRPCATLLRKSFPERKFFLPHSRCEISHSPDVFSHVSPASTNENSFRIDPNYRPTPASACPAVTIRLRGASLKLTSQNSTTPAPQPLKSPVNSLNFGCFRLISPAAQNFSSRSRQSCAVRTAWYSLTSAPLQLCTGWRAQSYSLVQPGVPHFYSLVQLGTPWYSLVQDKKKNSFQKIPPCRM